MIIWWFMSAGNVRNTFNNATGSIAMGPTAAQKRYGTELEFQH